MPVEPLHSLASRAFSEKPWPGDRLGGLLGLGA